MPQSEAEYTCAVDTGAKTKEACNEEESICGSFIPLPDGKATL
jgi:hypothetical protein